MNPRRKLLATLAAGTLASALPAFAQKSGKLWRIGVLSQTSRQGDAVLRLQRELQQALRAAGYIEGQNLAIEWRYSDLDSARLKSNAEELVRLNVDLILTVNTTATHAAQKASATVPIVMINSADPVHSGFAKSLGRPGGNITGLSTMSPETGPKLLEFLLAITAASHPRLTRVAVLINPANSGNLLMQKNLEAAARGTRARLLPLAARNQADLANVFAAMKRERSEALILARDGMFAQLAQVLADQAAQLRLPTASGNRNFTEAGGLLSYSPRAGDSLKRVVSYVDRIFKGAKAGELPIEQPTQFELVINGKTAQALGLTIPQALLITAEKVIE